MPRKATDEELRLLKATHLEIPDEKLVEAVADHLIGIMNDTPLNIALAALADTLSIFCDKGDEVNKDRLLKYVNTRALGDLFAVWVRKSDAGKNDYDTPA